MTRKDADDAALGGVNLRLLSLRCGTCGAYQTLAAFERREGLNVYRYECELAPCVDEGRFLLVEVPVEVDDFARRDPTWRGGARHTGGGHGEPSAPEPPAE